MRIDKNPICNENGTEKKKSHRFLITSLKKKQSIKVSSSSLFPFFFFFTKINPPINKTFRPLPWFQRNIFVSGYSTQKNHKKTNEIRSEFLRIFFLLNNKEVFMSLLKNNVVN